MFEFCVGLCLGYILYSCNLFFNLLLDFVIGKVLLFEVLCDVFL